MNIYKKLIQISIFCMVVITSTMTAYAGSTGVLDITPLQAMSRQSDVIVLDVRTAQEFNAGHIENAINVDIRDSAFAEKIEGFDRKTSYLVHCGGNVPNGRAEKAIGIMSDKGFSNIENLVGGYVGWVSAGGKKVSMAQ